MAAKQNVKRRIVDAAWELFYEKGYDDTTVDDIIRLSETSKVSFRSSSIERSKGNWSSSEKARMFPLLLMAPYFATKRSYT